MQIFVKTYVQLDHARRVDGWTDDQSRWGDATSKMKADLPPLPCLTLPCPALLCVCLDVSSGDITASRARPSPSRWSLPTLSTTSSRRFVPRPEASGTGELARVRRVYLCVCVCLCVIAYVCVGGWTDGRSEDATEDDPVLRNARIDLPLGMVSGRTRRSDQEKEKERERGISDGSPSWSFSTIDSPGTFPISRSSSPTDHSIKDRRPFSDELLTETAGTGTALSTGGPTLESMVDDSR